MQDKSDTLEPKFPCNYCSRSSNLKCIWCSTIYCSVFCQYKDYNDHETICLKSKGIVSNLIPVGPMKISPNKISNSHIVRDLNNMRKKRLAREEAFKKPTISVQHRLKDACLRDSKVQSSATVKVPESKVEGNKKWENYEIPTKLDEDGYFEATIIDFSTPKLGLQSYIVSPVEFKDQYINHLKQLQQVYKSSTLEPLLHDRIKKCDLVVALLEITWHRATVLEVNDTMVVVRSIETGTTVYVEDLSKIKAPLPAELQKKAFTIEVIFENDHDIKVDLNTIVSIKMTTNFKGTNSAMLKIIDKISDEKVKDSGDFKHEEVFKKFESISIRDKPDTLFDFKAISDGSVEQKVVNKVKVTSADVRTTQNKSFDDRKYLNSQMVKDFHTGDNIKLTFLDGSQLSNGLAHFCEFRPENVDFYWKIDMEIEKYVANNADQGNYKPAVNELVLAKFNDGLYYRGVCKKVKDQLALIYFLDYGGFEEVEIKNIMKIPSNFLYTICAHTCRVKFTGEELSNLNLEATVTKLFDEQHFTCHVEKLRNDEYPYLMTIDKSFAVFIKTEFPS